MKYLNGVLILIMLIAFTACGGGGNDTKSMLTSTSWALDVDAVLKEHKMSETVPKEVKEGLMKTRFNFKKGGKMTTVTGFINEEKSGSWALSKDGKTVTMTQEKTGQETSAKILALSSSKLIIETEINGIKNKVVLIPAK